MRFYPFVFTGKERDEETGYGYFGARYMDHVLMTMWLSVDPMIEHGTGTCPRTITRYLNGQLTFSSPFFSLLITFNQFKRYSQAYH